MRFRERTGTDSTVCHRSWAHTGSLTGHSPDLAGASLNHSQCNEEYHRMYSFTHRGALGVAFIVFTSRVITVDAARKVPEMGGAPGKRSCGVPGGAHVQSLLAFCRKARLPGKASTQLNIDISLKKERLCRLPVWNLVSLTNIYIYNILYIYPL